MRSKIIASAAVMFLGGAGVLSFAVPAFAATAVNTPVTVEVTGGGLSISAPGTSVDLGSVGASTNSQVVSNSIGTVTVADTRAGTAGWIATVYAPDFTGPAVISTFTAGSVTYTPGTATVTGTAVVSATFENHLNPAAPVQTATGVSGSNTAAWSPTIAVTIPASALIGQYSTTITHSVA